MEKDYSKQRLLDALQAHGHRLLNSCALPENFFLPKSDNQKSQKILAKTTDGEDDEWIGITEVDGENNIAESDKFPFTPSENNGRNQCTNRDVVFFEDVSRSTSSRKVDRKTIMTSKLCQLTADESKLHSVEGEKVERTNAENDAILHRLIHTKLLSGFSNPELDLTPAQRQKSLDGCILELSCKVKPGKGEKTIREEERKRASKRVRDGLLQKQEMISKQKIMEAKNLGNYHPKLKRLFESSDVLPRKRQRGLGMGVGKFRGGCLMLGQEDIAKVYDRDCTHDRRRPRDIRKVTKGRRRRKGS